jgi:hypothetical protein
MNELDITLVLLAIFIVVSFASKKWDGIESSFLVYPDGNRSVTDHLNI